MSTVDDLEALETSCNDFWEDYSGLKFDKGYYRWSTNRKIHDMIVARELNSSGVFNKGLSDLRLKTIAFQSAMEAGCIK